jgi:small-conductance mechanosensitive channel
MHTRGVISLVLTVLLCLPSLAGAVAVLANALLQRHIGEWGVASSALVATAVFMGRPLVVIAVVLSGLVGLSRSVSQKVKYAHYVIVTLATVATFSLTLRFGM